MRSQRFGTPEFTAGRRTRAQQAAAPEGADFAAWLKARGFRFDEPSHKTEPAGLVPGFA